MSAQAYTTAPSPSGTQPPANGTNRTAISRAALRTRPRFQRIMIRSWEYNPAVRITVLIIRLLVVLWLLFLCAALLSVGYTWGWALLPSAAAVLAIGTWVFTTAGKAGRSVER